MNKALSISVLVFFILFTGCSGAAQEKEGNVVPSHAQDPSSFSLPTLSFVEPVVLNINQDCLNNAKNIISISSDCPNLGEKLLTDDVVATIDTQSRSLPKNKDFDIILTIENKNSSAPIPPYAFPSFLTIDPDAFMIHISYLSDDEVYVRYAKEPQGYPQYMHYDGKEWKEFVPWDLVKDDFPDEIEPPLSVRMSEEYVEITEENYCCGSRYAAYDSDRFNYREQMILSKEDYSIVEVKQVDR
jgi:hypothetical protein